MPRAKHADKYCYPDTTVAYYLLRGHSLQRARVRQILNGRTWKVSPIVRMEYLRGVIITLIDFHSLLKQSGSVNDALAEWSAQFNQRRIRVVMQHLSSILLSQKAADDRTIVARRVGEYVRELLEEFDEEFAHPVRNHLACELAKLHLPAATYKDVHLLKLFERFVEIAEGTPKCSQCGFRKFWLRKLAKDGVDLYSSAQRANYPGKQNAGYKKQAELIEKSTEVLSDSPDCRWCSMVGDTMIALQCPDDLELVGGDRSFEAMSDVLGKEFVYVPSIQALRRGG